MAENNAQQGKSIEEQEKILEEVVAKEAREKAIEYYKSKNYFSPELIEQIITDYKTDDPQILDKRQEFDMIVEQLKKVILTKKLKIIQRTIDESPLGRFEKMLRDIMWKNGMTHINPFNSNAKEQKNVDKMLEGFEKKNAQKENGEVR